MMKRTIAAAILLMLSMCASAEDWKFGVSGDSRNCGDIVMPSIADGIHKDKASFYWHLGDFRLGLGRDEDMMSAGDVSGHELRIWQYPGREWPDFIENQLQPFGATPVFLTIGNHELVYPKNRKKYLKVFARWLNQKEIVQQRSPEETTNTYYAFRQGQVEFLALDNASDHQFTPAQVEWIERTLASAAKDATVKSVVVGMHAALPDSLAGEHSMNEWKRGVISGRRVYADLLRWRAATKKPVYVLASHSHYFMEGTFHNSAHPNPADELPGWIVGTAGAHRYKLPPEAKQAKQAKANVYGYLLATVHDDGQIDFKFHELKHDLLRDDVSPAIKAKYGDAAVKECFSNNRDKGGESEGELPSAGIKSSETAPPKN